MISTPMIWIVLPLFTAAGLWFIRRNRVLVAGIAVIICLLLAVLAWVMPFSGVARFGPVILEVSSTLTVLGRRFILSEGDRFLLIFLYLLGSMWFMGEGVVRRNQAFVPFGLACISLSISALAVDPFLYSALIVEVLVLISIPMILPPGSTVGQGVMRFLVFQTIAMALILLAGWAADGVDLNPSDTDLITQALILLGMGFIFWTAVFPFHTWLPQLASEAPPLQAGFLFNLLSIVVLLLGLDFLNGFGWLRNFNGLAGILRLTGAITVAAGGIWSAFERKLDRYMGFCLIAETGFSILALSLQNETGYRLLVASFLPRTLFLALWSMSLNTIKQNLPELDQSAGILQQKPVEGIMLLIASFAFSGFPLLGFFILRQSLLENLAQASLPTAVWCMAGMLGLTAGSLRLLMSFFTAPGSGELKSLRATDWRRVILLVLGAALLLLTGLMPQWFLSPLFNILDAFGNLV